MKELLPKPLHGASSKREGGNSYTEPPSSISKYPIDDSLKWGPYEKRCPSLDPLLQILQGPQQ
jgi:hypothetical protein